jgi:outer membrane protein TolC
LLASKRAFYVPTVGAQAELTGTENSGAGSGGVSFEGLPPDIVFPRPNGLDWNIAVSASLPLFNGGALRAQRARAQLELDEFTLQLEATRQRVEQRVRSSMHATLSSWAAIDLSRQAAEAARNNLDLVSDAYAEGLVEIIRVVDAQNQALVAELVAANSVYD